MGEAVNDVQKTLKKMEWPSDVIWTIGGSAEDMKDSFGYLAYALMAGILLVYMVMASQFESLLEPFVILLSIPMASVGVALALYLTGTDLTLTAAIGGLMLVGIVVNNAIVLIDYLKQRWDGQVGHPHGRGCGGRKGPVASHPHDHPHHHFSHGPSRIGRR